MHKINLIAALMLAAAPLAANAADGTITFNGKVTDKTCTISTPGGEDFAVTFLTRQGMQLLDRNWRCSEGEIDLVMRDGDVVVVCEVKTRRSRAFGDPVHAITRAKLARLRRLAGRWLAEHRVDAARVEVEGPAVGIVRRAGDPHRDDVLEAEEAADDDRPVGPRAGPGDDEAVAPRLHRPAARPVRGDPVLDVGRVAGEFLLDVAALCHGTTLVEI